MNTPLISIVIPVYNRQRHIHACLDSCLVQDHRPLEIVVVDDGSTDASESIVRQFFETHQQATHVTFRYLKQVHAGAQHARNLGIEHASGEYVQLLDSDDMLMPTALTEKLHAFTDVHSVVFGDSIMIDDAGLHIRKFTHTNFSEATAICYLASRSILTSSLLFRRRCFDNIRFDPSIHVMQDRELSIRLLIAGFRFMYCGKFVEYHRLPGADNDNISSKTWVYTNPLRYIYSYSKMLNHVALLDHATVTQVTKHTCAGLWKRGRDLVRAGKYKHAKRYFARAIVINARHIPKSFMYRLAAGMLSCITLERMVQTYKGYRNRVHVKKVLTS